MQGTQGARLKGFLTCVHPGASEFKPGNLCGGSVGPEGREPVLRGSPMGMFPWQRAAAITLIPAYYRSW